ncbi:cell division site-positioning protein MapZ family protein [Streptococcus dentapri]|uniref:Mid-cell-anchored protein Z n=1 Tax=Streptococcus dentapri TaxID=573564 RepID=A0ABV8CYD7_9STRE
MTKENDKLDFEDAKDLTVREALQKHKEIEAGVTEDDGVLDKYIKQHRDQVAAEKFETQTSDFENIDTSSLDNFIKKQREELANQGVLDDNSESSPEETSDDAPASQDNKEVDEFIDETVVFAPLKGDSDFSTNQLKEASVQDEDFLIDDDTKGVESQEDLDMGDNMTLSHKNKKLIIGGLLALLVLIIGSGFGINYFMNQPSKATSSSESSNVKSNGKSAYQQFQKSYDSFFIDKKQTQLKNSQFDKLSNLESDLKKLDGTSYYKDAKANYNGLNKQITAIKAVNKLFDTDVIVDGKLIDDAKAKPDADFDSLSEDTLKTNNTTLNKLLKSAIAKGRKQLEAAKSSTSSSSSGADSVTESGESGQNADAGTGSNSGSAAIPSGGNIRQAGITSYDPSTLQRSKSRVPYNESAVADTGNSAWTFGDGILEKIVSTSQSRGYFSGDDYILEPVNIINGNGYYNMYKSDGTYLFSLNCKTGYFFGNASGRPTDY